MTDVIAETQIQDLDPGTLLVDQNVRHDVRLDKAFLGSVRDLGVLQPIIAVRTTGGAVRVRFGHRRTLAAIEAGRSTVPVVVVADEAADDAAQVERLVSQYAENEHRTGLSTAERIDVFAQLSAFGVSATQIAKRTKTERKGVDAALIVARSPLAQAAAARYDFLDLTEAAALAEFEDEPETVTALVAAASIGRFPHVVQHARDERARRQRRELVAASLQEVGVTVVEPDRALTRLSSLTDAEGAVLTPETHVDCPGHAAYVDVAYGQVDPATGWPVPADQNDPDQDGADPHEADDDDVDLEEDDDAPGTVWGEFPVPAWVCTDPTERPRPSVARPRRRRPDQAQALRDDRGGRRGCPRRTPRRDRQQQGVAQFRPGPLGLAAHPAGPSDPAEGQRRPGGYRAGPRRRDDRPTRRKHSLPTSSGASRAATAVTPTWPPSSSRSGLWRTT